MELNSNPNEESNFANEMPHGIVDKFMTDHSKDPYFVKLLAEARRSFEECSLGRDED